MTPAQPPLSFFPFPTEVERLLAIGSIGRDHLAKTAALALGLVPGQPAAQRLPLGLHARNMLISAFAEAPLDGDMALMLGQAKLPREFALPEDLQGVLSAYAQFWQPPNAAHPFHALKGPGDAEARARLVQEAGSLEPRNLFWKAEAWRLGVVHGLWEPASKQIFSTDWPRALAPVRLLAQAQCRLALGDAEAALLCLDELPAIFPGAPELVLRGECLMRLGRRAEALTAWTDCLRAAPWRTNVLLRLHDVATGVCDRLELPPQSVAILLYSYNKAKELDETLASLADSLTTIGTANASVWVLDNGSTDETPQVLAAWEKRLGDRLSVVRLPVNIGAPAARNWLLALPEVRKHGFVAFLDDDVTLPADWLHRLGAAVAAAPGASVWGCRVVDEYSPLVAQCVDYTPLAPDEQGRRLNLPNLHAALPDLGQFTYLRPCVSVTGCCHLLRTVDLDRTGGFDIRFSPSQCDDIERDVRLGLGGGHAVYQGHLSIGHKRRSGQAAERSAQAEGNATANTHKLETKHSLEDFQRLYEHGVTLLTEDLAAKRRWLAQGQFA